MNKKHGGILQLPIKTQITDVMERVSSFRDKDFNRSVQVFDDFKLLQISQHHCSFSAFPLPLVKDT